MHGRKAAPTTGIQDAQELLDPEDPCHPKDPQDRDLRNLGRYKFTSNTISFQSFLRQMTVLTRKWKPHQLLLGLYIYIYICIYKTLKSFE